MDARTLQRPGADTMPRPILAEDQIHPAIRATVASLHSDVLAEVQSAMARHAVVVVGMAGNPFVRKARRALDAAGVAHHDLDYGSYVAQWRRRSDFIRDGPTT